MQKYPLSRPFQPQQGHFLKKVFHQPRLVSILLAEMSHTCQLCEHRHRMQKFPLSPFQPPHASTRPNPQKLVFCQPCLVSILLAELSHHCSL